MRHFIKSSKVAWVVTALSLFTLSGIYSFRSFKYADEVLVINRRPDVETDGFHFVDTKIKIFQLDSVTSPEVINYSSVYEPAAGGAYFTFLNEASGRIYFYDLHSQGFSHKIELVDYRITPSQKVQGYYLLNNDSLLLYCYERNEIELISLSKGKLFHATIPDISNRKSPENVFPFVTNGSPLEFDKSDSSVLMCGFLADEGGGTDLNSARRVMCGLSLSTGKKDFFLHYPSFYSKGNWGGAGGYRQPFYDFDKKGQLVVSFMADHRLTVISQDRKRIEYHYAGSRFIDTIKSMPYSPNYFDFISREEKRRYIQNGSFYSVVIFDPYRNLYYRFAELPAKGAQSKRDIVVIMLDDRFKKLGEIVLDGGLFIIRNVFVDQSGLWVERRGYSHDALAFNLIQFVL